MAALTQQQTEIEEKGAARAFWDGLMQKHPGIHGVLSIVSSVFGFFANGHFIVALGHWTIRTAGRIAETALLLATLWITAANVAPDLVGKLGEASVSNLNAVSLIAFSLLPEIIVFGAIIITYEHWARFFRDRRATNPAWVWATLYTIPTSSFVVMTVLTISSFVTHDGTATHATGAALVARCLSGWFYSLVELIFAAIGRRYQQTITPRLVEDRLAEIVATTRATLEQQVANIVTDARRLVNDQVATIQGHLSISVASEVAKVQETTERQVATLVATISEGIDAKVATIEKAIGRQVATIATTQVARPATDQQGITSEQFEMLVQLINRQATTIQQLSSSLAEIRKETRTVVTEIREIRSSTQEIPAAIGAPAAIRALPAPGATTTEQDLAEKPGPRVLRFLQDCQGRGYKPTLAEIQEVCQVAKKTATTYRKSFYGEGESSPPDEEE